MYNFSCVLWLVISFFGLIGASATEAGLDDLPPLFQMDDFYECKAKNGTYCHAVLQLKPTCNSTKIWKNILESKKIMYKYPRDLLYRGVCLFEELQGKDEEAIFKNISNEVKKIVQNLSLEAETISIQSWVKTPTNSFDTFVLVFCLVYVLVISTATVVDFFSENKEPCLEKPGATKVIVLFSLLHNWKKFIKNSSTEPNFLKPLQGMRSYAMLTVISVHVWFSISMIYISNFSYIEEFIKLYEIPLNFGMNIVQVFFLMSSWLLAMKVQKEIERRNFELKQVFTIFLSRICRLMPTLVVMVLLHRSCLSTKLFDGPFIFFAYNDKMECHHNWWANILFVNNFFYPGEMCNIVTWYVSADTQMYAISLILFFIMHKLKLGMRFLGVFLTISFIWYTLILFSYNKGAAFNFNSPLIIRIENLKKSIQFWLFHTSTIANSTTYILGLCFGTFYYKYKKQTFFNGQAILWIIPFVGLPLLVSFLKMFTYSRLTSAIIGALFKPLYAFGIGIGLLGMIQSKGGVVQKIFDNRPVQLMAKTTYSIYILHITIVYTKMLAIYQPLDLSNSILVYYTVCGFAKSLLAGFVGHMLVEQPWVNVQNMVTKALSSQEENIKEK